MVFAGIKIGNMIEDNTINLIIDYIKLKEEKNINARSQRYELAAGARDREKPIINKIYDIILPLTKTGRESKHILLVDDVVTTGPTLEDAMVLYSPNDSEKIEISVFYKEYVIKKFLLENFDINIDVGGAVKLTRELKLKSIGL